MAVKWLCALGIVLSVAVAAAQQRWLAAGERALTTDGGLDGVSPAESGQRPDDGRSGA